ncbi:ApbE family lipoprotein [uncultured Desulfatiglans sp.]|uniref:ApbE family lipoprotein n=1 Tax=Uncultured Desulfatiglans sp. TaxID=1748965 RepID=A0A653A8P0_UNCDX|nr:ApbE family lipoprotein [uncultured Desulfatiglans sp.]
MSPFEPRDYRMKAQAKGLTSFGVAVRQTDLWVQAESLLAEEARSLILEARRQIESYIAAHPEFLKALLPQKEDMFAPPLVKIMLRAGRAAGVGPMAAVAGAVAQYVGEGLLEFSPQVIVENGGDIFLATQRDATVAIYAGKSPLSGRVGIRVPAERMPLGVCTSSGSVGHSLSLGESDAVCIVCRSAALADAVATAVGNRLFKAADLASAAREASSTPGILGGVLILKDRLASWGEFELLAL